MATGYIWMKVVKEYQQLSILANTTGGLFHTVLGEANYKHRAKLRLLNNYSCLLNSRALKLTSHHKKKCVTVIVHIQGVKRGIFNDFL